MRRALPVLSPAVLGALLVLLVSLVAARPAQAAGCSATVHVQGTVILVQLEPSSVTVRQGDCVGFVNDLAVPVDVHVDPAFDRQVPPGGQVTYPAKRAGAHAMSAGTLVFRDDGTLTVRRTQPQRTPSSPAPTSEPPATSEPRSPQPSDGGSGGPRVAPTPSFSGFPTPSFQSPTGTPPSVAGPSVSPYPTAPVPTSSPTAVATGPIEPASGRGAGLPAAVAALSIVGAGAGLVRVLLAEPVDDLPGVGGRA